MSFETDSKAPDVAFSGAFLISTIGIIRYAEESRPIMKTKVVFVLLLFVTPATGRQLHHL